MKFVLNSYFGECKYTWGQMTWESGLCVIKFFTLCYSLVVIRQRSSFSSSFGVSMLYFCADCVDLIYLLARGNFQRIKMLMFFMMTFFFSLIIKEVTVS